MENRDFSNIKKIFIVDEKAIGRGKRIGNRFERFDPNAIDGDNDGTVQEGTAFERPSTPRNMPKVNPIKVPRREEVPAPTPPRRVPTTPEPTKVPEPSKPEKVPTSATKKPARKLSGKMRTPGDGDDFFEIFEDDELDEFRKIEDEVFDEIAESITEGIDIDNSLQEILDDADRDGRWDTADVDLSQEEKQRIERQIDFLDTYLRSHPFSRESRNYEQSEWADDEADSQAQRYAPRPSELESADRGVPIDWDKLMNRTFGRYPVDDTVDMDSISEDDWEDALSRMMDNGETPESIFESYPDVGSVEKMRAGLVEWGRYSGYRRKDVYNKMRDIYGDVDEAVLGEEIDFLLKKFSKSSSKQQMIRKIREQIEDEKNLAKRISNEYQMMRKANVEAWRLGASLMETKPERGPGEGLVEFQQRLYNWWYEASSSLSGLAEKINNHYDISTATDRARDYQYKKVAELERLLQDPDGTWNKIQQWKGSGGGGSLSGQMRGASRMTSRAARDRSRQVVARKKQLDRELASLKAAGSRGRTTVQMPPLNRREKAIRARQQSANMGFFRSMFESRKNRRKQPKPMKQAIGNRQGQQTPKK